LTLHRDRRGLRAGGRNRRWLAPLRLFPFVLLSAVLLLIARSDASFFRISHSTQDELFIIAFMTVPCLRLSLFPFAVFLGNPNQFRKRLPVPGMR
jgi:hypothetical protein